MSGCEFCHTSSDDDECPVTICDEASCPKDMAVIKPEFHLDDELPSGMNVVSAEEAGVTEVPCANVTITLANGLVVSPAYASSAFTSSEFLKEAGLNPDADPVLLTRRGLNGMFSGGDKDRSLRFGRIGGKKIGSQRKGPRPGQQRPDPDLEFASWMTPDPEEAEAA